MSRQKLHRFAINDQAANIIQDGKPLYTTIKGQWHEVFFKNQQPIVLELGCGRGEYTVGLGEAFKDRNFIGVDIKGNRMYVGSQYALRNGLNNIGFLRTHIQNIEQFFAVGEVAEIWITFPDPRPKQRQAKRRLTHPRFLNSYYNILKPGGTIHLKTDNTGLFDYTLDILKLLPVEGLSYTYDLYQSEWQDEHKGIKTKYELLFTSLGQRIKYVRFSLPQGLTEADFERAAELSALWDENYDFDPTDAAKLADQLRENEDE